MQSAWSWSLVRHQLALINHSWGILFSITYEVDGTNSANANINSVFIIHSNWDVLMLNQIRAVAGACSFSPKKATCLKSPMWKTDRFLSLWNSPFPNTIWTEDLRWKGVALLCSSSQISTDICCIYVYPKSIPCWVSVPETKFSFTQLTICFQQANPPFSIGFV